MKSGLQKNYYNHTHNENYQINLKNGPILGAQSHYNFSIFLILIK